MKKIDLLVIDDEKVEVQRQLRELREYDTKGVLGDILFYNSFPDDIENVDFSDFIKVNETDTVDAILIDYDLHLKSRYSGTLLSAWLALKNKHIPRIAFTTRNYTGSKNDFDGFLLKNDVVDNPEYVLAQLVDIIEKCNIEGWLDKKYIELIEQYGKLCEKRLKDRLSEEEELTLKYLCKVLDNMDKQLDKQLEKTINVKFKMADKQNEKLEYIKANINEIDIQICDILDKLSKSMRDKNE